MKAFIVLNEKAKPIAATTDEAIAMDVLFNLALQEGRVDEDRGTFDFGDSTILDTDLETLRESMLLTGEEMDQLEEEGAVLI
jgi:hypothetical protein